MFDFWVGTSGFLRVKVHKVGGLMEAPGKTHCTHLCSWLSRPCHEVELLTWSVVIVLTLGIVR